MAGGREQKKLGKPLRGIQFLEITARYDCLGTFFGKKYIPFRFSEWQNSK
jgi:hypothetical protein